MSDVRHTEHSRHEHCYEWQGIRLLLLGLGVLAVLLVVVVLTFKVVGEGMNYIISTKAWPVALGALIFGALAGIATVVKAFAAPMGKVVDIVGLRKLSHGRVGSKDSAQQHERP